MSIAEKTVTISANNTTIAENEQKVYDAGKKAQYDEFWDSFQDYGKRTNYSQTFANRGWTVENFEPKYDMRPTTAYQMFYQLGFNNDEYKSLNLKSALENSGATLDFSKATDMRYCFQTSKISCLPVIDLSSATSLQATFCNMYWLKSIEKIIVNENTEFSNTCFSNCYANSVIFEGALGCNLIYKTTTLDYESVISIMSILVDYSGTEVTRTLTFNANTKAKLSESDIAIANQKGWTIA